MTAMEEVHRSLGSLEAKMDQILGQNPMHCKRLSDLERWKNKSTGILMALTALVSFMGWYLREVGLHVPR